ncbi:lysophospholipid acyltransferase family protein [Pseudoroseicyclus sp. CXY001]|uniref:lysophospholipid acyltransferase family protein n=1 Tax=Pseudoroseicyclus sp. CXY001 TaxID=3242492 RepID=UPI003570C68A
MTDLSNRKLRAIGPVAPPQERAPRVYDRASLTYSETFDSAFKRNAIKTIEWMTGKIEILRRVRRFEKLGATPGAAFWTASMKVMGIEIQTPQVEIDRIPKTGPVVFVANHPHGLVDGMVLADIFSRVREDYRILSRSILTGLDESASKFMIPVPFPHEPDSQKKMVAMRAEAMEHLSAGGLVALFPSGVVASADTPFGPPIEAEWNVFTAKMIRRSGATVVPCYFPGHNSRWYQLANAISPTLRQGLLIHEIVHSFDKPQRPVIGEPISPEECERRAQDPRGFMTWLRAKTLSLGETL